MNPYKVLGVPQGATTDQIKARYRELSKRWHPDRPGGSESRMKEINDAYAQIKDGAPPTHHEDVRKGTKDPFGFYYQYGNQAEYWEQMMKNMRQQQEWSKMRYEWSWGVHETPKTKKKCPHCNGTGKVDA